jgi:predicted phosphodiesterase
MTTKFIHLSDIHFRENWAENQNVVLEKAINDIKFQISELEPSDIFIVFSGDIVMAGERQTLYHEFLEHFNRQLDSIGLTKSQRICVPGNHDVSLKWIKDNFVNHNAVLGQNLDEKTFNDYVENSSTILKDKFQHYIEFENVFATYGVANGLATGKGFVVNDNIGIFCLNSAIFSSGDSSKDFNNLAIDTRRIHEWLQTCQAKFKILIMHHPITWLNQWAKKEIELIANEHFCLLLTGHEHDQGVIQVNRGPRGTMTHCSAPALFTKKQDELGYSIITLDPNLGVTKVNYRQWTKHRSFVSGCNFSNNDSGCVEIAGTTNSNTTAENEDSILRMLRNKFEASLKSYSGQPVIWVTPELSLECENTKDSENESAEVALQIENLIRSPVDTLVYAPPQFGLTSISYFLSYQAWKINKSNTWIRLDSAALKPHGIKEEVNSQLDILGLDESNIACLVVDSWENTENKKVKLLKKLREFYPSIPLFVLETRSSNVFKPSNDIEQICDSKFKYLHLNSLPRHKIREMVVQYNVSKNIHDNDDVLLKNIIADLEVLNLHRTPLNCITLLKVSEVDFDDSPVNRTEVIKRILYLLFNVDNVAHYKRRPDLKDCEHVLGWYCESILRSNKLSFSRHDFLNSMQRFCTQSVIDIEIQVLFDTLAENNIIIRIGNDFRFKFTYWVMYFAAQRMHQDISFRNFIFEDKRYASFPELIEFYTGIDRHRDDALEILINDLNEVRELISQKLGFPDELNLYKVAHWTPTQESLEELMNEFDSEVQQSKLPDSVKDKYADRNYDPSKPYNQDIKNILNEYLLELLTQLLRSSSRGLRNSDYAKPEIKKKLLDVIIQCWEVITKILLVLSPILTNKGIGEFEGTRFILVGKALELPPLQKFEAIVKNLPANVLEWFGDDLYSPKMGPLLFSNLEQGSNLLHKHYLIMLIIEKRPHNWMDKVQDYIVSSSKNSFYLFSVEKTLAKEQKLGFLSSANVADIIYLRKMVLAKHQTGIKKPGKKLIDKLKFNDKY